MPKEAGADHHRAEIQGRAVHSGVARERLLQAVADWFECRSVIAVMQAMCEAGLPPKMIAHGNVSATGTPLAAAARYARRSCPAREHQPLFCCLIPRGTALPCRSR